MFLSLLFNSVNSFIPFGALISASLVPLSIKQQYSCVHCCHTFDGSKALSLTMTKMSPVCHEPCLVSRRDTSRSTLDVNDPLCKFWSRIFTFSCWSNKAMFLWWAQTPVPTAQPGSPIGIFSLLSADIYCTSEFSNMPYLSRPASEREQVSFHVSLTWLMCLRLSWIIYI